MVPAIQIIHKNIFMYISQVTDNLIEIFPGFQYRAAGNNSHLKELTHLCRNQSKTLKMPCPPSQTIPNTFYIMIVNIKHLPNKHGLFHREDTSEKGSAY